MEKEEYFLLSNTIQKTVMQHQFRHTQDTSAQCSCGWLNDCVAKRSKRKRFAGHLASMSAKAYMSELEK